MGIMILMALPWVEGCRVNDSSSLGWSVGFSLPADSAGNAHLGLAGPVVGVHEGMLFIGGGANFPSGMPWQGHKKEYDRRLFAYGQGTDEGIIPLGQWLLPDTVAYGANCNTPQGVVVAGGESQQGLSDKVVLIAWDSAAQAPLFQPLPSLPLPTANASLALLGSTLYMAGGEQPDAVSDQLHALDLGRIEAGWQALASLPYPVSHASMVAQADGLYLIGGRKRNPGGVSDFYSGVWRYDVQQDEWRARSPLPKAISAATAVALGDDQLLFIGGDDGGTFLQVEAAIAASSQEADPGRRAAIDAQKVELLSGHPGFESTVWQYHVDDDSWKAAGDIPLTTPVTTTATWWKGRLYLPSGEVRAGMRSPDVLVGIWADRQ